MLVPEERNDYAFSPMYSEENVKEQKERMTMVLLGEVRETSVKANINIRQFFTGYTEGPFDCRSWPLIL
ncbi:hypothetical protein CFP56_034523 [Quercus suber]|uniref:Uncharacterized protein n=1 Tax=Quercus suber TaxID=58331 RepID=A0AAW0LQY0_QUESU